MKHGFYRICFYSIMLAFLNSCASLIPDTTDSVRGTKRLTGRDFLLPNESEAADYGLYSYVIFTRPVDANNRAHYEAVASAYLDIPEVERFEELSIQRTDLNVTYFPILEEPPDEPSATWLVDNYDHAHAQVLVRSIDARSSPGPYILSYFKPLSGTASVDNGRLLYQDLSSVPADLVFLWVQDFIAQVSRPQYWNTRALTRLMLDLRTNIAVFARAFSEVREVHPDVAALLNKSIRLYE